MTLEEQVKKINEESDIPAKVGKCNYCGHEMILYADEPIDYCSTECVIRMQVHIEDKGV